MFQQTNDEREEEVRRDKSGFARWGWTITTEHLCKELGLKPSEVYEMHVHEFLYWCSYFRAKQEETERQQELQRMRNGNR